MSASVNRRQGLLALFGAGSAAAAVGGAGPAGIALGRLRPGFAGGTFRGAARALGPGAEGAFPLDREIPAGLVQLAGGLDGEAGALGIPAGCVLSAAACRTIAALATAFPSEVAAPRSFGPPMRRRLYADLLARESRRSARPAEPPATPPASPGPDA